MTGMLIEGKWTNSPQPQNADGAFDRKPTTFRTLVEDGSAHPPTSDRYRLYVSYACPWAHRALIVRALRKLDDAIDLSVVNAFMGSDGWTFDPDEGVVPDPDGATYLREVYLRAAPDFTGRVTVPVLWDRKTSTIVNNESREIIRMFDRSFAALGDPRVDLCPADLEEAVDAAIDDIYEPINNGVYRAGFAGNQRAYDAAIDELFSALARYDRLLGSQRYLTGDRLTEADICLFTTLVRFDVVYHTHFKCNVRRIVDFENLWGFTREIYQLPGVAAVTHLGHIRDHYYRSHESLNPRRIVARGPTLQLDSAHGRDRLTGRPLVS